MSVLRPAVIGFALTSLIDAGGAVRVALDHPRAHDWVLVGYLAFAAVLFAVASYRRGRQECRRTVTNGDQITRIPRAETPRWLR